MAQCAQDKKGLSSASGLSCAQRKCKASLCERQLTEQSLSLLREMCSCRGMYVRLPNWHHLTQIKTPRAAITQRRKNVIIILKEQTQTRTNNSGQFCIILKHQSNELFTFCLQFFFHSFIQYVQRNLRTHSVPKAVLTKHRSSKKL